MTNARTSPHTFPARGAPQSITTTPALATALATRVGREARSRMTSQASAATTNGTVA